ncbi:MAG: hypothetical protein R3F43_06040 [bacterium]
MVQPTRPGVAESGLHRAGDGVEALGRLGEEGHRADEVAEDAGVSLLAGG